MCSIIFDSFWRCLGLGSKEKCGPFFIGTKALLMYDIVSDFVYWNSVRNDEDVPEWARVLVLVFACLGVLVDAIGSCRVCCTSVPDAWGKDEAEASNRYTIGQKKLALAIVAAEDIPQLCMSTWITVVCKQSNMTTQYMLTVTGTVLNILRVILLSSGYLFCERRASKIMMKRNRDCVRIRCCGLCTVQTYNWEPTGYFGELSRPDGGTEDVELCCYCCR